MHRQNHLSCECGFELLVWRSICNEQTRPVDDFVHSFARSDGYDCGLAGFQRYDIAIAKSPFLELVEQAAGGYLVGIAKDWYRWWPWWKVPFASPEREEVVGGDREDDRQERVDDVVGGRMHVCVCCTLCLPRH